MENLKCQLKSWNRCKTFTWISLHLIFTTTTRAYKSFYSLLKISDILHACSRLNACRYLFFYTKTKTLFEISSSAICIITISYLIFHFHFCWQNPQYFLVFSSEQKTNITGANYLLLKPGSKQQKKLLKPDLIAGI